MEAVAKGAGEEGGISVGLLPGETVKQGNDFLTIKIPTGIGFARNFLVIRGGEVVIAIDGASGTMSELYLALSSGRIVALSNFIAYCPKSKLFSILLPADAVTCEANSRGPFSL